MSKSRSFLSSYSCLVLFLGVCGISNTAGAATPSVQLTVKGAGATPGRVISTPAGIDCPGRCTASFPVGTAVELTPAAEPGMWIGTLTIR